MGEIQSNIITAQAAISELVGLDTSGLTDQHVAFSYTRDIAGMESARQVTNQMLQAVNSFSEAVLIQANKIPEIAQKLEKRDIELSQRWES